MIDLAVLGLLKEQQLHGYELKKRSQELLGARGPMSFGSLYPALARLEKAGEVVAVEEEPPIPMPMTGSLAGEVAAFQAARRRVARPGYGRRRRKVYGITRRGEERLAALLEQPDEDDRTFTVQLAFARHLPAPARWSLLTARRRQLEARLAREERGLEPGTGRLDGYLRSIREHAVESTRHDLAWIDRLLDAEEAAEPAIAAGVGGRPPFEHTEGRPSGPTPTPSDVGTIAAGVGPTGNEHTGGPQT